MEDNEKNLCQQQPQPSQQQQSSTVTQQQQQQQQATQPNSIMTNEISNITNVINEKKKLVRRAFSMPRNLFRLSCRLKNSNKPIQPKIHANDVPPKTLTTNTTTVTTTTVSCNQSAQTDNLNDKPIEIMENVKSITPSSSSLNETVPEINVDSTKLNQCAGKSQQHQQSGHRLFRRSAWKKFLQRISQQISLSNTGVSI